MGTDIGMEVAYSLKSERYSVSFVKLGVLLRAASKSGLDCQGFGQIGIDSDDVRPKHLKQR
jgi:hypothetical protein